MIRITAEAHNAIRSLATPGMFRDVMKRTADGMYEISLDDEVVARISEMAFPGESVSDTIVRVIATKLNSKSH